jgi:ABC-type branched-subunit amino acid transport system substrate-binding protein
VRWFDPDSTTFEEPIRALAADSPQAVLVLAENGRQVLQVAPQLVYYGLRTSVIAGGDAWSEPEVLRRLDPVFANFRVLGTLADRTRRGGAWSVLREAWEREYREALPETVFPALGWDAARLLRAALPQDGLPRAGVVARRLRTLHDVVGATGTIDVDSVTGRPRRRAEVRMIIDGTLVAPDTAAIRESVERARLLEERLREAEEEKEKAAGEEGADPGARPR